MEVGSETRGTLAAGWNGLIGCSKNLVIRDKASKGFRDCFAST
jgi:hypothetical protein